MGKKAGVLCSEMRLVAGYEPSAQSDGVHAKQAIYLQIRSCPKMWLRYLNCLEGPALFMQLAFPVVSPTLCCQHQS